MYVTNLKRAKILVCILCLLFCTTVKSQTCACDSQVISQEDFERYKANYRANFLTATGTVDKRHTEWIYLPRNYFIFLNNFLKLTPSSDGVWIYFISLHSNIDPLQQIDKDQILINFFASENKLPTFKKLNAFLNASSDLNTNNKIFLSTSSSTNTVSLIGPKRIFNFTEDQLLTNQYNYKLAFKDQSTGNIEKKYSERVHICRTHIRQIANALEANANWKGVKLYFGSYNAQITCVGNEDPKQLTLLLLPVEDRKSIGNFDKYNQFLVSKKITKDNADIYNHGSLCPQICN